MQYRVAVVRQPGLITTALLVSLLAQQIPPQPTFRSGVDVVQVDVSVLDEQRRPVRGLTAADFAITVDGAPQPIVAFQEVALPPRPIPTAAWMRDVAPDVKTNAFGEPRLFLIVMDDLRTPFDPYMVSTGKAVARAIVDELLPSDLAAVIFTKNNSYAQELTGDRSLLLAAIESFRGGSIPEDRLFSSGMSAGVLQRALEVLGRRPQGRSAIMFISVGGGIADEPDATRTTDVPGAGILAETEAQLARLQREARLADQIGLSAVVDQTRIHRIPIYGFGIAGLLAEGTAAVNNMAPRELQAPRFTNRSAVLGGDALTALADASGGRAIVNDNEPARAVPAVFEENSAYYLIGYRASYRLDDGKARAMQIRVNRPGVIVTPSVRLLHPPTPVKRAAAAPPPLLRAMSEIVPRSDLRLAVAAAPFVMPATRPTEVASGVLAALRVQRPAPSARTTEEVDALAKVFTPEGKELLAVGQRAAIILRPSDTDAVFDILVPLRLKPGRYNIRYSARSARLDKTGSVYTDVIVPDFSRERLAMSGIVLTAEPMPVAAPRDAFAAIVPVVPTTRREFETMDRASAFLRVYQANKTKAPVDVTVRIVDANGADVATKTDRLPAERFATGSGADVTYDLPLRTLPPGSYLLSIRATLDQKTSAARDVRFSVR